MRRIVKLLLIGLAVSILELLFCAYLIYPWFDGYSGGIDHLISKVSGNSVVIAVCTYLLCERLDKIIKLLENERKGEPADKKDNHGFMK